MLGYDPEPVASPRDALAAFTADHPDHPYAALGPHLEESMEWFRGVVPGMRLEGGLDRNMLLPSAIGVPRPTAFAPASIAAGDLAPIRHLAVVGFHPLKDFFPSLLAENLSRGALPGGARVEARPIDLTVSPRPGRADVGGPVYARAFDEPDFRARVADALRVRIEDGEHVALPAVVGLRRGGEAWDDLRERLGAPVFEIPTLPPSVPGMRLQHELLDAFAAAGGRLVLGPTAVGCGVGGRAAHGDRGARRGARARHHRRRRRAGDRGLLRRRPGARLLRRPARDRARSGGDRPARGRPPLSPRQLDHQPLMSAGLTVDDALRPVDASGAATWGNLHAAGTIVGGAAPWREKSGEGIAIAGGYRAASAILEGT